MRVLTIAANPRWGQPTQVPSGFMAYEYRCVRVKDDKINPKLKQWADAGWELHTATAIMTGIGKYEKPTTISTFDGRSDSSRFAPTGVVMMHGFPEWI